MSSLLVSAEDLLAGSDATYDVELSVELLPSLNGGDPRHVRIRPLTLRDVQLITKAARDDDVLTSVLMIQRALVEPPLKEKEIAAMRSGVVRFLVEQINRISGLTSDGDAQRELAESPFMHAAVILAKEFGWTPEQMRSLTLAQVVGFIEGLQRVRSSPAGAPR
ncbi:MAG TPA: hypothetical protein VES88_12155 [Gemmatimonadaceae bacterium]|nr:hypothetical protein [Gemmatimonadaceae bacterium]